MTTRWRGPLAAWGCCAVALLLAGCGGPGRRPAPSPVARYNTAKSLFLRGQFLSAADAFRQWLRDYADNPLEPAALYYLGRSEYQANRPEEAAAAYQRLADAYRNTEWAGFASQDLAALKAGLAPLPRGRRRLRWWWPGDWFTPDPPAVKAFKRARRLFDRRKYEEAIAAFRSLAERHSENPLAPAAWHYVGRSHERLGQLPKARETFQLITEAYRGTHWQKLAQEDLDRLKE